MPCDFRHIQVEEATWQKITMETCVEVVLV
jgi:hypothetical protein